MKFIIIAINNMARMAMLRSSLLYTQQAPFVALLDPHEYVKFLKIQETSKIAPTTIGPGMLPKSLKMKDCMPKANVRCSSATHLSQHTHTWSDSNTK